MTDSPADIPTQRSPGDHPPQECDRPPEGWSCSRARGHEGPCAARPSNGRETAYVDHPTIPGAFTPAPLAPQSFAPVRVSTKRDTPVPTVVLFYLDDVPYPIPREVPAAYVVGLLRDLRDMSEGAAVSRIMTLMLGGDQAMQDLQNAEGLEMEQLNEILDVVRKMSLAAAKKATGK